MNKPVSTSTSDKAKEVIEKMMELEKIKKRKTKSSGFWASLREAYWRKNES